MSGGPVEACGNCGAPFEPGEDGSCGWCRAKVRQARPRLRRTNLNARTNGGARTDQGVRVQRLWRMGAIAAAAVVLAAGLGVGIASYVNSHQAGPPTAAGPRGAVPLASVPPESTDLQALRQDFGPWQQLGGQSTGSPALLLLQNAGVSASKRWTVPSGSTQWAQDLGGNVTSVQVTGTHAAIADTDGVGYTVGVNQPFIISGNPGTVLMISPDSTVMSMSLAQATAVRQPLGK